MAELAPAVATAIRVRLLRIHKTQEQMISGLSHKPTYYNDRLNGRHDWTLGDLEEISKQLGLKDPQALLALAEQEQHLAA